MNEKEETQSSQESTEGQISEETTEVGKELSITEKAEVAASSLKEQLDRQEELIARQEAANAKEQLYGSADAGSPSEEKKEESAVEYRERIMKGEK